MRLNVFRLNLVTALTVGALAAGTALASAQSTNSTPSTTHGAKGGQLKERLQMIADELQLTDKQKEEIRPIIQEQFEKGRSLRQDTSLTQEERRAKLKDLRQDTAAKLKPILTPQQLDKFEKMRDNMRQKKQSS